MTFIWPLPGPISRDFFYKASIYIGGQHGAVDIPASSGTPIKVVATGRVSKVGYNDISGYYVEVAHSGGWVTNYRHLVEQAVVSAGAGVSQGQIIGNVGSTGWSTGPHLHLDLWNKVKQSPEAMYKVGWWAHDPELYLGQEEEEMTDEEFLTRLTKLLTRAVITTTQEDGETPTSGGWTLGHWLNESRLHQLDKDKHESSDGLKRGDTVTLG